MEEKNEKLTAEDIFLAGLGVVSYTIDKGKELFKLMKQEGEKLKDKSKELSNEVSNLFKNDCIDNDLLKQAKDDLKQAGEKVSKGTAEIFNKAKEKGLDAINKLSDKKGTVDETVNSNLERKEDLVAQIKAMAQEDIDDIKKLLKDLSKKD